MLLKVLAVEGGQGDHRVHALRGVVRRVCPVHQVLHLPQQNAHAAQAAVVLNGAVLEGRPPLQPSALLLRLELLVVDDVHRLHDIGHVLGGHGPIPPVGDAGGHQPVGLEHKPVPGEGRGYAPVEGVPENLHRLLEQADPLADGVELAQGAVGQGAEDIAPGIVALNLPEILDVGRRLREAQPHLGKEGLHHVQLQPHHPAAAGVPANPHPVELPDDAVPVPPLPGQAQQRLMDEAEEGEIQAPQQPGGELAQLLQGLLPRVGQVVQQGEELPPQQLHAPVHQLQLPPLLPVQARPVCLQTPVLRLPPGGEGRDLLQIGDVFLLIWPHRRSPLPPAI